MLELLLMGISGVATSPLLDFVSSDEEDDDGNDRFRQGEGTTAQLDDAEAAPERQGRGSGGSILDFLRRDGDDDGPVGKRASGGGEGRGMSDAVADLMERATGATNAHGGSGEVTIFGDDADWIGDDEGFPGLTSEWADWYEDAQRAMTEMDEPMDDQDEVSVAEGEAADQGPAAETEAEDGSEASVVEVETYLVGEGEGSVPVAEVADFVPGENLLQVTIFAEEEMEDVEIGIEASEDGESSVVTADGQALAVVLGVAELDFEDLVVNFEAPPEG